MKYEYELILKTYCSEGESFFSIFDSVKTFIMKKIITSLLFLLIVSISFSQLISHTSVRLSDQERDGYIELEKFWSKIHQQAIKDGYSQRWMIWEFIYADDKDAQGKPDFLIMNFYKDSIQKSKSANLNIKEYARQVYKGKLSKSRFERKWNLPTGSRNFYELERLDNTYWHGKIEEGMQITLNAFKAVNDDYEDYEMKFFKKWHEKNILDGSRKWWEFNKVLSSNLTTESSTVGTPTHVTIDMFGRELTQQDRQDFQNSLTFEDLMLRKNGAASRELLGRYQLKLLMFQ